ncbi:MAG TPA: T9SS type A sorting domain-containing protein [Bacteroidota bacterium]|nr:T9SS type A sorting domain-containing protein [Candidatus Kapabacteria bacterium]HRS02321.1 T9SS type A sorting domain-containing protein [Bacteroidota bacterium]
MKKLILIIAFLLITFQVVFSQWVECNNGLYGVPILSIAANENRTFVSTYDGIYLTTDDGNSWIKKLSDKAEDYHRSFYQLTLGCNSAQYDYKLKQYLFSLGGLYADNKIVSAGHGGLYTSSDNGENWILKTTTGGMSTIDVIDSTFFLPANNWRTIKDGGIYIWSSSGGLKYKLETVYIVALAHNSNTLFAGTMGKGIYATTDKGETWIQKNNGLTTDSIISLATKGDTIYAGSWNKGVFISTDNGDNWQRTNNKISVWPIMKLAINNNMVIAGTFGNSIFISMDNCQTWELKNKGLGDNFIISLATLGNKIWAGTRRGLYLSTDYGESWTPRNNGLNELDIMALDTINNTLFAASRTNGVFISTDYGESWIVKNNGLGDNSIYAIAHSGNNIFIATPGQGVWRSTNMGENWEKKNNGLANQDIITLTIKYDGTIFAGGNGISRSTDNGESWITCNKGLNRLITVALTSKDDYILAANSWSFCENTMADIPISVSPNNGNNWFQYNTKLYYEQIFKFTTDKERIYTGSRRGLWASSDYGYNWEKIPIIIKSDTIGGQIKAIAVSSNNIFVALMDTFLVSNTTIYISTDKGSHWFGEKNSGFQKFPYFSDFKIMGEYLFAATDKGIYRAKISDLTNTSDVKEIDEQGFSIFPNPASDYIYINSHLIEWAGGVYNNSCGGWQYQIYDILGNCVQSGMIESDKININQLSAGFYTVRFYNSGKQVVEKMIKE